MPAVGKEGLFPPAREWVGGLCLVRVGGAVGRGEVGCALSGRGSLSHLRLFRDKWEPHSRELHTRAIAEPRTPVGGAGAGCL